MNDVEKTVKALQDAGIEIPQEMLDNLPQASEEEMRLRNVWMVMNFYKDDTSEWKNVKADAKDERSVRESNVLIFAHNHPYTQECVKTCQEF